MREYNGIMGVLMRYDSGTFSEAPKYLGRQLDVADYLTDHLFLSVSHRSLNLEARAETWLLVEAETPAVQERGSADYKNNTERRRKPVKRILVVPQRGP